MDIEDLLRRKKSAIVERYSKMIADTYAADTARFVLEKRDRFGNPVGHAIAEQAEALFDALLEPEVPKELPVLMEPLLRIRAVQDFTPAQAVGFVFFLKKAIRQEFDNEIGKPGMAAQLLPIESRIDDLALLAFDLYMRCREEIYKLRTDEVKRQTRSLLGRANRSERVAERTTES